MVRRLRRSTLFTLIAVIALLSLGIGYAAWSDGMVINGTVNTGTLNQGWAGSSAHSEVDPLGVGVCATNVAQAGDKTMTVTVDKAYPGYSCTFDGVIRQYGSIPGILNDVNVNLQGNGNVLTVTGCENLTLPVTVGADRTCRSTVTFDSSNNDHQGQTYTFAITLDFSTS